VAADNVPADIHTVQSAYPMAYLSSAALSALYGKLWRNRRGWFRTTLTGFLLRAHLFCCRGSLTQIPLRSRRSRSGTPCLPLPTLRGSTPYHQRQTRGASSAVAGSLGLSRCPGGVALAPFLQWPQDHP